MKKAVILFLLAGAITGAFVMSSIAASDQDNDYPCDQSGMRHGIMMGMMGNDAPCMKDSDGGMGPMKHQPGQGHRMDERMGHLNMLERDGGHMMNNRQRMGNGHMMGSRTEHMMGGRTEHMMFLDRAKELGLSDDQVGKLKSIHSACRKDNIRLAADLKISRLELAEVLDGDSWTVKQAEPLVHTVQQLEGKMHLRHLQGISDARKVLTAEQLKLAQSGGDANLESLFE